MSSPTQRFLKITYRGIDYRWSPTAGFTKASGMAVPAALKPILEAQIEATLNAEDAAIDDPALLTERAEQARKLKQYARAEKLARRATQLAPELPDAAAVLGAILMDRNQPQKALAVTEPFAEADCAAVLQVRALAYADLHRYSLARPPLKRALELIAELGERPHPEIALLAERLDKGTPE